MRKKVIFFSVVIILLVIYVYGILLIRPTFDDFTTLCTQKRCRLAAIFRLLWQYLAAGRCSLGVSQWHRHGNISCVQSPDCYRRSSDLCISCLQIVAGFGCLPSGSNVGGPVLFYISLYAGYRSQCRRHQPDPLSAVWSYLGDGPCQR